MSEKEILIEEIKKFCKEMRLQDKELLEMGDEIGLSGFYVYEELERKLYEWKY